MCHGFMSSDDSLISPLYNVKMREKKVLFATIISNPQERQRNHLAVPDVARLTAYP